MKQTADARRISVALCSCNGAKFIAEQIDSICRQSLPPFEIVLHDDASTDDTVAVAKAAWTRCRDEGLPAPDLQILVHGHRLGVAANFAGALRVCRGELIALCDQDDHWHSDRLAFAAALFDAQPARLLVHGNARLVDGSGQSLNMDLFDALEITPAELAALEQGRALEVLLDRNLVTGAATLVRRELLDLALPVPAHWVHDEWLAAVAAANHGLFVTRRCLLDYRQHGNNQIGAQQEHWLAALSRLVSPRGDFLPYRLARAQELLERLQRMHPPASPGVVRLVEEKVAHHAVRAKLPANRLLRLWPVWREWRTGRYQRFGRGIRGLAKDLLEGP